MTNKQVIDYVDKSFNRLERALQSSMQILKENQENPIFEDFSAQSAFRIAMYNIEIDIQRVRLEQLDTRNFLQMALPVKPDSKSLVDEARDLQDCEPEGPQNDRKVTK